jgi:ATP-dependent 26S proteasome regulatory subunit
LNILDGLQESPGRIIVMTTNKPESLDKAFIRPGRIDFNICFNKATVEDIKNILNFFWEKSVDILPDELNYKYSHAEITNFCRISESLEETIQKILTKN